MALGLGAIVRAQKVGGQVSAHRSARTRAQALVASVLKLIEQEQDLHRALTLSVWLARYLWANFCGIYRLDALEEALLLKLPAMHWPEEPLGCKSELHVASAVFHTGGHTLLVRSLMAEADSPPDVLITWPADPQEVATILAVDASRLDVPASGVPSLTHIPRWASKMAGYERIVLHLHPDDVAAALAVRLAKRINPALVVGFMNHADHAFSVAVGVADKVFEISAYGWALRDQRGSIGKSSFVGIPIAQPKERPANAGQGGFAFSGGTAFKYKPFRGKSLPEVLRKLLARAPYVKLVIIGPKSKDYWWWRLRLQGRERVQMMKPVPREKYLQLLNACTYYIDSYPWPGGTAFPEALMRGGNVAGLLGGSSGYSYADILRSDSDEDFLMTCLQLSAGDLAVLNRQSEVRLRCIAFHDPQAVRARLLAGFEQREGVTPPAEMLARQQVPAAELDWSDNGRSITPSLKNLQLDHVIRRNLLAIHVRHFGWLTHATLKLAFDLYLKKIKP
jgi:glycosyltransferase involved in cell wall biosynthesis